jgi:hypothetical protein
MKSLEECNSEYQLMEAVNTLPKGLDEAYVKTVIECRFFIN